METFTRHLGLLPSLARCEAIGYTLRSRERSERRKAIETSTPAWSPLASTSRERSERRKAIETISWRDRFIALLTS